MLGVVGDLNKKRVMAWEIGSELDIDALEKEVSHYRPSFVVTASKGGFLFTCSDFCLLASDCFLYADLFTLALDTISKDEFFKHFKRTY